jgi:hypothetical protein
MGKGKRPEKKRKRAKERSRRTGWTESWTTRDIPSEVRYITELAERAEGRVVATAPLVFFSTETGDAWMLDIEDGYALPLVRGGTRLPARVLDAEARTTVEWTHDFAIEGETMLFADRKGRFRAVEGYPVREILEAVSRWPSAGPTPE